MLLTGCQIERSRETKERLKEIKGSAKETDWKRRVKAIGKNAKESLNTRGNEIDEVSDKRKGQKSRKETIRRNIIV